MFHARRRATAIVAQLAAVAALSCAVAAAETPDRKIVDDLRHGGYTLFIRHFQTDPSQEDTDPLHPENKAGQRQLTDAGRAQAKAFGEALRKLAIPIDRIVCSTFQRTHESAKLIGIGEPVPTPDVSAILSSTDPKETERRKDALRRLLSTPPPAGKNTLIVSHNGNLRDAAGVEYSDVGEGEVVVFQPEGNGNFRKVARISPPSVWTEWSDSK